MRSLRYLDISYCDSLSNLSVVDVQHVGRIELSSSVLLQICWLKDLAL